MPASSVFPILLLFLTALGGLLILIHRRLRSGIIPQPAVLPPMPASRFAMHASETTRSWQASVLSEAKTSSGTPFPPPAQGELILVVDDEASVRDLLCTVLLNHGYQVISAGDGVEGMALFTARQSEIDLVITDLHMPRSSGQTFADSLRPIRPDIRILFMSGLDSAEAGEEPGPARSTDPFLLKPFRPVALLGAVHKLLHPDQPTHS